MKKNKSFLSWYMCIGIFILMLWLVNFPSLGDCDCTLKLSVESYSHPYVHAYIIEGDFDLVPAGCCGASVANKEVEIYVWTDKEFKIYTTKTDNDGKFEQTVTGAAERYYVWISYVLPNTSYGTRGSCPIGGWKYCDFDWCLRCTAEQAKAAPALTSWGSITLSVLLAGSLAWMIRRKMIARRSRA